MPLGLKGEGSFVTVKLDPPPFSEWRQFEHVTPGEQNPAKGQQARAQDHPEVRTDGPSRDFLGLGAPEHERTLSVGAWDGDVPSGDSLPRSPGNILHQQQHVPGDQQHGARYFCSGNRLPSSSFGSAGSSGHNSRGGLPPSPASQGVTRDPYQRYIDRSFQQAGNGRGRHIRPWWRPGLRLRNMVCVMNQP